MNRHVSDHGEQGGELNRDPLAPVTHGLDFIAEHRRFWVADDEVVTPTARDALRRLADQVIILNDLPQQGEVDSDLQATIDPYPPIRSQMPFAGLSGVVEQVRIALEPPTQ